MSCPACARFHQATPIPKLKAKYVDTGKVRLIIREFPLNNLAAAALDVGALCRHAGKKSIALIDVLFEKQQDWASNKAGAGAVAQDRQSRPASRKRPSIKCLQDDKLLGKLSRRRDRADKEFGVDATPSFFVNGKRMRTRNFSIETFDRVLEPLLKSS